MNFRAVVDALVDPIAVFAPDGSFAFANRAFEREIGRASFRPINDRAWRDALAAALATDGSFDHELDIQAATGMRRCAVSLSRSDGQVCARFGDSELADALNAERVAREAASRLHQLTAVLSGTTDQSAVVRVMVDRGRTALGADAGFAWLLVDDDQLVLAAAEDPNDPSDLGRYTRFSLSAGFPICDAVRMREPLMFENLEAMLAAYPDAAPRNASLYHAWCVVPFVAGDRALGGISFSFLNERAFSDDDRTLLSAMTSQVALALERAQLIAAERGARQAAEAATQRYIASEENLRVALVAGRAATWSVDLATMRTTRDPAFLQLVGIEQASADADFGLVHPDDRPIARAAFERTLRDRVAYTPEVRLLRGDGRYMWIRSYGRLVYDATGTPSSLSGVTVDVDEAKRTSLRAEHERQVNETLHRLAAEFASVLDHDRLVDLIVDEVAKLTGAEVAGFVEGEALPASSSEGLRWLMVPVTGPTGTRYGTLRLAHRDARKFTDEHVRLAENISKHASVALENARLYREMRAHETELQAAVETARLANHRKDEFLAMLGHELRNPVAPIVTTLDLIELKQGALDRNHQTIRRHVDHLRRLIDDLLDVSRIARGKLQLEKRRIALGDSIAHAIEMVSPLIDSRQQRLTAEVAPDLEVIADAARITQVVSNVLTNAAKYSDRNSELRLRAYPTADTVVIEVEDHGLGLSPEMREAIFEPFVQGERSLARSEGGLGIGLSVARVICEAHGGSITAASSGPGQGSTFTIVLPRAISA